ncbi:MAG: glycosyltransferase family 2 protein [Methanobacteriota archaeon]|nr:MAG: glycosyltransferase family 2 protein [Euryarchaeota archaeon]
MDKVGVVAVIPAYNEEKTVGGVVEEVRRYVDLVIVVDDGSNDKTGEVAEKHGARVVRHVRRRGVGAAVATGYDEALKTGGELFVQLDADGQHRPEDIPRVLAPIVRGEADLVIGSRFLGGKAPDMPLTKRFGNWLFTKLTKLVSGVEISDSQSGFRAIRREALETLFLHGVYTYTQEMIIRAVKEGWRVKEIPINVVRRYSGRSKVVTNPFSYAFRAMLIMTRTIRDYNPIAFFGGLGLVSLSAGLLLSAYILVTVITTGRVGAYPRLILASLLVLSGVQLLFFGLLADMLKGVSREIKSQVRRA